MTIVQDQPPAIEKLSWTEERVELLKKLWTEGLSASQIAGRLSQGSRATPSSAKCTAWVFPAGSRRSGRRGREPAGHGSQAIRDERSCRPRAPRRSNPASRAQPVARPEPEPEPIRLIDIPKGERVNILICRIAPADGRWAIPARKIFSSAAIRRRRAAGPTANTTPGWPTSRCRTASVTGRPPAEERRAAIAATFETLVEGIAHAAHGADGIALAAALRDLRRRPTCTSTVRSST